MSAWIPEQVAAKRKLYITVTNDDGETVYQTWNSDEGYKTVTLYLDETEPPLTDARKDVMGEVIGMSRWDHTQAGQLVQEGIVLVKVSDELVEQMGDDWSPLVQCRLTKNEDGTYEMQSRTVG